MSIGKQAKILTPLQQDLVLKHIEMMRYPVRNSVIFLLSFKAGLRAKEIANLTWSMVCDSTGSIGNTINLPNMACKGKKSSRVIRCIKI